MTDFKNRSISLPEHIRNLSSNFENFTKCFPKIYLAAELNNDILDQFFTERFEYKDNVLWETLTSVMLFGVHMSWLQSFYLIASGLSDTGLAACRKAIEYVCYISKIYGSDKRAKLWQEKSKDINSSKRFSNEFSIPKCYFSDKYEILIPLLVYYDYASEFGVHGNLRSFATKWKEVKESGDISMSFQDDSQWIPQSSDINVQVGSFIIDALLSILKVHIKGYDEFSKSIESKRNSTRDARIESAKYTYGNNVDYQILKAINENDMTGIYGLYEDIKKKYSQNKSN